MRTLAIDLGGRRIGLALSDEGGTLATPLEVVVVASAEAGTGPVLEVVRREQVRRLVVGLPLNMDGSAGDAAQAAMRWGRKLAARSGVPVVFIDERLSSFAAEQTLSRRRRAGEKLTHKRKKQQRDALAAATFLQDFLDGKLVPLDVP